MNNRRGGGNELTAGYPMDRNGRVSFDRTSPVARIRDNSSDTDSGIFPDSGSEQSQLSPKRLGTFLQNQSRERGREPPPLPHHPGFQPLPSFPLQLPKEENGSGVWRLRKQPSRSKTPTPSPSINSISSDNTDTPKPGKPPLRVRFADEVSVESKQPSGESQPLPVASSSPREIWAQHPPSPHQSQPNQHPQPLLTQSQSRNFPPQQKAAYYYVTGSRESVSNGRTPSIGENEETECCCPSSSHQLPPRSPIRVSSPKHLPPPYYAAVDRIRQLRQFSGPGSNSVDSRNSRNFARTSPNYRSASLPRFVSQFRQGEKSRQRDYEDAILHCNNCDYVEQARFRPQPRPSMSGAKSMDNIAMTAASKSSHNVMIPNSNGFYNPCVMPSGSCDDIITLSSDNTPNHKRRVMKTKALPPKSPRSGQPHRTSSARTVPQHAFQRYGSDERMHQYQEKSVFVPNRSHPDKGRIPHSYSEQEMKKRRIRVRLLGLDCHGIQTLELEKLTPGPFGFFIASGLHNKVKGIFISRVSAASLESILSIGDQIYSIDTIPVKGLTLEQVQAMIANKHKITLRVHPVSLR